MVNVRRFGAAIFPPAPARCRVGAVRGCGLGTERSNMGILWLAVIILVVLALFTLGVRGRVY